jgi:hypothetical protein
MLTTPIKAITSVIADKISKSLSAFFLVNNLLPQATQGCWPCPYFKRTLYSLSSCIQFQSVFLCCVVLWASRFPLFIMVPTSLLTTEFEIKECMIVLLLFVLVVCYL